MVEGLNRAGQRFLVWRPEPCPFNQNAVLGDSGALVRALYDCIAFLLPIETLAARIKGITMSKALLNAKQLVEYTGLCRMTIWRYENAGQFPSRIKIGPKRVAWRKSDVDAWIESLATAVPAQN